MFIPSHLFDRGGTGPTGRQSADKRQAIGSKHPLRFSKLFRRWFRKPFRYCSASGSATRMRPQYSQMIIFLPERIST